MSMTFYCGSGSPYAWRVWLALEHKRIPYELRMLSFSAGDLKTPAYSAINPRQRVPALVDDGFALYESVAILEYLDERFAEPPRLYPGDARQRAQVRRRVQEADQYVAVAMERLVDQLLFTPPERQDEAEIAAARQALADELRRWDAPIPGGFLAGEAPTAADFTLYPLIALTRRLQLRRPSLDVESMLGPGLADWARRVEALPCVAATWPPHWKAAS